MGKYGVEISNPSSKFSHKFDDQIAPLQQMFYDLLFKYALYFGMHLILSGIY